ncbi:hypothetical protein E4U17_001624 [Claviceps sp. LM77 group G4]|nr:hypothetical protein E4U17_001624 [Claviceps sp. LM77 group G4]KAG6073889.1 hypothetical protein E4U33_002714 [Claviceps sp. LM78 group G4]KAG6083852.1 hypothetical protein E4U16_003195 [Claviceps sp. LM84 group G4]
MAGDGDEDWEGKWSWREAAVVRESPRAAKPRFDGHAPMSTTNMVLERSEPQRRSRPSGPQILRVQCLRIPQWGGGSNVLCLAVQC